MARKIAPDSYVFEGVNHVFTYDEAVREIQAYFYLGEISRREMESAFADLVIIELGLA